MANKFVQYCTNTKLSCALISNAQVILCLEDAALLAPTDCPDSSVETYTNSFLAATICQAYTTTEGCGPSRWYYTFSYDETLLADINVPITADDITGVFCKDCLVNYLEYKIGSEVYIRTEEDGSQYLVTQHGCEYEINGGSAVATPIVNLDALSINYTTLTNSYVAMGFLDVEGRAKQITIDNNTNADIQISYNGIADGPIIEANTFRELNFAANNGFLSATDVYIKYLTAAPTVGVVTVDGYY